jgi:hypothetical protein
MGSVSNAELNGILWEERTLLETLHFALETEEWVMATGRTRWLDRSSGQVSAVVDRLRRTEILRASAADAVAARMGLAASAPLAVIAAHSSEPWRSILSEQRLALIAATDVVGRVSNATIDAISGFRASREPGRAEPPMS